MLSVLRRSWLRTERTDPPLATVLLLFRGGRRIDGDDETPPAAGLDDDATAAILALARVESAEGRPVVVVVPLILVVFRARGDDVVNSPVSPFSSSMTALCSRALCVAALLSLMRRLWPLPGASTGLSVTSSSIIPGPADSLDTIELCDLGVGTAAGRDSSSSSSSSTSASALAG